MYSNSSYEAWIDVGGTFTDCYVYSQHEPLKRCKLLSSGFVPLSCKRYTPCSLQAPELSADISEFWIGADLRVLSSSGEELARRRVTGFASGTLTWSDDLGEFNGVDCRFELDAGIEAPVLAVRRLLGCPLRSTLPKLRVRLGTTRGTNALLTRRGANTALAITSTFEDLLNIGDQTRPNLFELGIRKPAPIVQQVVGIRERLSAAGEILTALEVDHATEQLIAARASGCDSLAICLMHSYLNPVHELQLEEVARKVGFEFISRSSAVAPLIEFVARTQTSVVDAYLSPIIRSYLSKLKLQFGGEHVQLQVMTSGGGLSHWQEYSGKDSILSGPAGGVVGLQGISKSLGIAHLIGLDMGGTSTDVSRIGEDHQLQYESTKAGVRILTPTLPIETVASGGGSVCWFDGVAMRVGPQSAGASPGPACYGRGGPLTITDLNVYLKRLPIQQFQFPVDSQAIARRLDEILHQVRTVIPISSREELAEGFRRLANEQMSAAVRTVSIAQGIDPRTATLVGFGGAAGQHICEIAETLGVSKVIDSAEAGLLSALGMGLADLRRDAVVPIYQPVDECDWTACELLLNEKAEKLVEAIAGLGVPSSLIRTSMWLEMRYCGTDATLTVAWTDREQATDSFHQSHHRRFGYARHHRPLEIVSLRIECYGAAAHQLPAAYRVAEPESRADRPSSVPDWPIVSRAAILPGQRIVGPAIVLNHGSTLVIEEDWKAECLSDGTLELELMKEGPEMRIEPTRTVDASHSFDSVLRDCLAQRLSAIATQMGLVLQQTAVSVNVKQRRDYSCAVFDAAGHLLANAPHVPVHLGAMGETVRSIRRTFSTIVPEDCFITNDPYRGGSHLPDVTVITPVFADHTTTPVMFVANRAHHADIGGVTPGSMSVVATRLGEEGVVIAPRYLVEHGEDRMEELRHLLASSPHPPRNIAENLADVAAQQAANERGVALLHDLAASLGWSKINRYAEHLLDAAAQRVSQFLSTLPQSPMEFTDYLDDGSPICVCISFPRAGAMRIDFAGTADVSSTNFNANPSIVTAAVMYVLRCLINDDLPLNEGVLRCVELCIPTGLLNPTPALDPSESPAVAAGNVETSQRVVDVLLGAFSVAAASQGTMNNLLFGNRRFGFYETICGGAGAIWGCDGASGVHTHMTNTRLTDPEILESRYPVRLIQFHLRSGSGGEGKWRGGDGIVRELEFLEPVELSLLTSRRGRYAPFGVSGGKPGAIGRNTLIRADGREEILSSSCHLIMDCGDRLEIQTPGGGGFGT
jgi:5-oxoprolinase (ATP-hydrolysing)